jgi:hypothetical protein
MVNGAVAGLVCITPGCGYMDVTGSFFTGLFGGCLYYFGAQLKHIVFKVDDALDAFGIDAVGTSKLSQYDIYVVKILILKIVCLFCTSIICLCKYVIQKQNVNNIK